ncbi:MAG: maleylacetoacetate isomerase, partial [Thiomonas sp. 14-64-326]
MKLYTYFRSSAAYRVRIALHLKGLAFESVPVHLLRDGGQQHAAGYAAINPNETVPTLDDDGQILNQSLAIIEYLDETHPSPPLLPGSAADRARIRAIAQTIACDIHPINNLRVLQHLTRTFDLSEAQKAEWYCHWV